MLRAVSDSIQEERNIMKYPEILSLCILLLNAIIVFVAWLGTRKLSNDLDDRRKEFDRDLEEKRQEFLLELEEKRQKFAKDLQDREIELSKQLREEEAKSFIKVQEESKRPSPYEALILEKLLEAQKEDGDVIYCAYKEDTILFGWENVGQCSESATLLNSGERKTINDFKIALQHLEDKGYIYFDNSNQLSPKITILAQALEYGKEKESGDTTTQ